MLKCFVAALLLSAHAHAQPGPYARREVPYDLGHPTRVFELPGFLAEVSALTDVDDGTVACVHDEAATVYFLSLDSGTVTDSVPFAGAGDMEGLTRVGPHFYALRSDGLMYKLGDRASRLAVLDTFRLDLPNKNIEGLGFDETSGLVLISPKDVVKGSAGTRDERVIHGMDPSSTDRSTRVVLRLSVEEIVRAAGRKGIVVPIRTKGSGEEVTALKLRYSSVAVNPINGLYYLLSAVDRTLLITDRKGELIDLILLDGQLLPKPEGITFTPNGDLWISSEGKGRSPVLVGYGLIKRM